MKPSGRKVLHLLGSEEDTGGILSVIRNVSEATRDSGWSHLSLVHESFRETRHPPLNIRRSRHLVMERAGFREFLWRGLRSWLELRAFLRSEPCDILHAHSRGPLIVSLLSSITAGTPAIFANHAFARQKWFYRAAARCPRLVTTVLTPNMAAYYGLPIRSGHTEIISECCADEYFARPLPETPPPSSTRSRTLVGVGNLVRWKKWELVIRALSLIPPDLGNRMRFELWGPTPSDGDSQAYAKELRTLATNSGVDHLVRFAGATNSVPEVVRAADAFVLPSTNEPCSVALIEALALGIPAFVTASGGNVDILQPDRTGRLFAPDNPSALARSLSEWLQGKWYPAEPVIIRESVRQRSASVVGRQYLELYNRILAMHSTHPRAASAS